MVCSALWSLNRRDEKIHYNISMYNYLKLLKICSKFYVGVPVCRYWCLILSRPQLIYIFILGHSGWWTRSLICWIPRSLIPYFLAQVLWASFLIGPGSLRSSDIHQPSKAGCFTTSRLHLLIYRVQWRSWRPSLWLPTNKAKYSKQNKPHLIIMVSWRLQKTLVYCKLVMMFLGSFLLQFFFMWSGRVAEV